MNFSAVIKNSYWIFYLFFLFYFIIIIKIKI